MMITAGPVPRLKTQSGPLPRCSNVVFSKSSRVSIVEPAVRSRVTEPVSCPARGPAEVPGGQLDVDLETRPPPRRPGVAVELVVPVRPEAHGDAPRDGRRPGARRAAAGTSRRVLGARKVITFPAQTMVSNGSLIPRPGRSSSARSPSSQVGPGWSSSAAAEEHRVLVDAHDDVAPPSELAADAAGPAAGIEGCGRHGGRAGRRSGPRRAGRRPWAAIVPEALDVNQAEWFGSLVVELDPPGTSRSCHRSLFDGVYPAGQ